MGKLFKSPWLEVNVMLAVLIISYIALALITGSADTQPGAMSGGAIWGWLFGFFFLSFAIALVAVIGGIGGGVLFTPFMLAFTPVDSLIVRATGLILIAAIVLCIVARLVDHVDFTAVINLLMGIVPWVIS